MIEDKHRIGSFIPTSEIGIAFRLVGELHKSGKISLADCYILQRVIRPIAWAEWNEFSAREKSEREAFENRDKSKDIHVE